MEDERALEIKTLIERSLSAATTAVSANKEWVEKVRANWGSSEKPTLQTRDDNIRDDESML